MTKQTPEWEKEFEEKVMPLINADFDEEENEAWEVGRMNIEEIIQTRLKSFISSHFLPKADLLAEIERREKDFTDHICRFNDAPQKCECYAKGFSALASWIKEQ